MRRLTGEDLAKIKELKELWATLPQTMPARQPKTGNPLQDAMAASNLLATAPLLDAVPLLAAVEVEVQDSVAETLRVIMVLSAGFQARASRASPSPGADKDG